MSVKTDKQESNKTETRSQSETSTRDSTSQSDQAATQTLPTPKVGNEINPEFFAEIRDNHPLILKSNGLKSLQELIHGHRGALEKSEMSILKDIHKGLKDLAHGRNLEIHRDADESEIKSDKTISDHIKHISKRETVIKATSSLVYVPLTEKN